MSHSVLNVHISTVFELGDDYLCHSEYREIKSYWSACIFIEKSAHQLIRDQVRSTMRCVGFRFDRPTIQPFPKTFCFERQELAHRSVL